MASSRQVLSSILFVSLAAASLGISFDVTEAKKRPVTKVINLLKDMQSSLDGEAKADEETYEKMDCWCKTNSEEKSKSVAEAETRVKALTNRVNELAATGSRLATEIDSLKDEVSKNEAGMDTSMALRKQQVEGFHDDEKDLLASQSSVGSALDTLSAGDGSFLQMPKGRVLSVVSQLQTVLSKHEKLLTRAQREKVEYFVNNPLTFNSAFLQQKKTDPADSTGGIGGILTGLKDDFDSQLSELRTEEESDKKAYEGLVKAKREEIEAGKRQLEAKMEQKAAANLEHAQAKEDIKDTQASISADTALLTQVKEKCSDLDAEFQERRTMRSEEAEAVSKALEVLSADEAHDTFSKTFNPSFLQESSVSSRQERASAVLAEVGNKLDGRLVTLALTMKLDTFEKVKKAIDTMVSDLKKEQADEVKQKDWCLEEFQKNQLQTQEKTHEQQSKLAELDNLKSTVVGLGDDIKLLNSEVDEMNKQIQLASQNREAENKEFQAVVTEQRQTEQLLKQALTVLSDFYNKAPAFVQTKVANLQEPAPQFKEFNPQPASYGVLSMLQQLISDAKAMEGKATHAEKSAQESYEAFAKATTAAIEAKNTTLADKSEEKGAEEAALVEAREAKEGVDDELQQLADANFQLHESCDFVTQNFDARQSSREDEMEALQQAKSMLSGAQA